MENPPEELKAFLDQKVNLYNQRGFIENDPVSIPHKFTRKEDIEIAGFLAASISWGKRKSIISNANKLIDLMDASPFDFVLNFSNAELKPFEKFVHRTFNGSDCVAFLWSLKHIYQTYGGLEQVFTGSDVKSRILNFREVFFEILHPARVQKHVANPGCNSAAKRINMFLRWMVRHDDSGVDFGIWRSFSPSELMCPLDIHSGKVARKLGLLKRKQDDWRAAEELTSNLRKLNPVDPVKYDFALFGLGVNEKF